MSHASSKLSGCMGSLILYKRRAGTPDTRRNAATLTGIYLRIVLEDWGLAMATVTKSGNRQRGLLGALLCAAITATGMSAMAQEFSLFEDVETAPGAQPVQQRPGRESRVTTSAPPFTLVGTSRVGDKYGVILADQSGKQVYVETGPNTVTYVPTHVGYQIVGIEGTKVSLRHPESSPCIDFPDAGVHCTANEYIAELTLPNKPPVAQPRTPVQVNTAQENGNASDRLEEDPQNPFAIMRARARAQGAENVPDGANADTNPAGNDRFVPRRIDPSEVPPGSRVISTPFGDRVVQQ